MVTAGLTVPEAARYVGCVAKTIRREAYRDEQFRHELQTAELAVRTDPLKIMRNAAASHWRAAAWLLERTDSERYGRRPSDGCRIDQVEDALAQLIEITLEQTDADQHRRQLYLTLSAAAKAALIALFAVPRRKRPSEARRPHTPLTDMEEMLHQIDLGGERYVRRAAASEAQRKADAQRRKNIPAPPWPAAPSQPPAQVQSPTPDVLSREKMYPKGQNPGEFCPPSRDNPPRIPCPDNNTADKTNPILSPKIESPHSGTRLS